MKKSILLIFLMFFTLTFISCSDEPNINNDDKNKNEFPDDGDDDKIIGGGSVWHYKYKIILSNGDTLPEYKEGYFYPPHQHITIPKEIDYFTVEAGESPYFDVRGFSLKENYDLNSVILFYEMEVGDKQNLQIFSIKKTSNDSFLCEINRNEANAEAPSDIYFFLIVTPGELIDRKGNPEDFDRNHKDYITLRVTIEK